jgi:hypothetical protein
MEVPLMVFLVSQLLFLIFGLVGLVVWACSDVPLVWREIALNTRRDPSQGSSFAMVKVLSVCLKILAVIMWIFGIAVIIAVSATGSALNGLIPSID